MYIPQLLSSFMDIYVCVLVNSVLMGKYKTMGMHLNRMILLECCWNSEVGMVYYHSTGMESNVGKHLIT